MQWLRSHPYIDALLGAAILVLLGVLIVGQRTSVRDENTVPLAWGGVGSRFSDPIASVPGQSGDARQQNLYTQVQSGPPFVYNSAPPAPIPQNTSGDTDFDFDAFIAMVSSPQGRPASDGNQTTADAFLDAYSFIPSGLISTSTPAKARTAAQEELHDYGNLAGSEIESFEDSHRNMPQTLKDQFEDPRDSGKVAAVEELGNALAGVGRPLEAIDNVPAAVRSANSSVAASYKEMGTLLVEVPKAQTDDARLAAMLAYNASVERYIKNYVALATIFSAYGVTFASNESGSVFTFTQGSF